MNIKHLCAIAPISLCIFVCVMSSQGNESKVNPEIKFRFSNSHKSLIENQIGIVMCVYSVERKAFDAQVESLTFGATVVQRLKGEWSIGKKIKCMRFIERGAEIKTRDGDLLFLFTNGAGKDGVVFVGDGDIPRYDRELLRHLLDHKHEDPED